MTEKTMRRSFRLMVSARGRLIEEAERLRDEAKRLQSGIKRDELIQRARQLETEANTISGSSRPV